MQLLEILSEFSPKITNNGQIQMQCAFPENHSSDSAKRKQMYLSPDLNTYHCFSCGARGRMTVLLNSKFDVPYFEALEMVHIDQYEKVKTKELWEDDKIEYYWELVPPIEFTRRGFSERILKQFKVGYDDRNHIVVPMYQNKKLKGLLFRVDKGQEYLDKNDNWRVSEKRLFWYSDGFDKDHFLFNGDANYNDYVILVEGITDTWRLLMWGYNVYAVLGTGISEWQAARIAQCKNVYLAGNTDAPGMKAMKRWYDVLHKHTEVEFIELPKKDVDECTETEFADAFDNPCNYAYFKYLSGL